MLNKNKVKIDTIKSLVERINCIGNSFPGDGYIPAYTAGVFKGLKMAMGECNEMIEKIKQDIKNDNDSLTTDKPVGGADVNT